MWYWNKYKQYNRKNTLLQFKCFCLSPPRSVFPFISRWNVLLIGFRPWRDIPSPLFQPPFIRKKRELLFNFFDSAFIDCRGGPMCPPDSPDSLKWTVPGQTYGSVPTKNGRLKRSVGVHSLHCVLWRQIVKGLGKHGWNEDEGMYCHLQPFDSQCVLIKM